MFFVQLIKRIIKSGEYTHFRGFSLRKMSPPPSKKTKKDDSANASTSDDAVESKLVAQFENERNKTAANILEFRFEKSRVRILNGQPDVKENSNGVIYWMFRDQRVQDNWAFLFAQRLAMKSQTPLCVCFCLLEKFLDANMRHYRFLVRGLQEIETECRHLNINFHLFYGNGGTEVPKFVKKHNIGAVVCDLSPLRVPQQWVENLKKETPADVPVIQVDAHNIVPVWETSDKQEYAARTIRNKINSKLGKYLTDFPPLVRHSIDSPLKGIPKNDWKNCWKRVSIDELDDVKWATPGYKGAVEQLEKFCTKRLRDYATKRNDPLLDVQSDLSPWFHFGECHHNNAFMLTLEFQIINFNRSDCTTALHLGGAKIQIKVQRQCRRLLGRSDCSS